MAQNELSQHNTLSISGSESMTQKMDGLSFDVHEQYLEQLSLQHDMQVKNALIFYLPAQKEPVIFVDQGEINVGRQDSRGRIVPELNLADYAAAQLGVSRLHAQITWDGENYHIQDLHSTNFTWLNGQKLVPYHHYPITDGSIIQFAKLAVTVFIIKR